MGGRGERTVRVTTLAMKGEFEGGEVDGEFLGGEVREDGGVVDVVGGGED